VVPVSAQELSPAQQKRLYASAVIEGAAGEVIVKIVNAADAATVKVALAGVRAVTGGTKTVLQSDDLAAMNSFDAPGRIAPQESALPATSSTFEVQVPRNAFVVLRLAVAR
jgi:alpha-N-arabinofuranosidase